MKGLVAVIVLSLFAFMGCDFVSGSTGIPKLYDPDLIDTETAPGTDTDSSTDTDSNTDRSTDSDTDGRTDTDSSTDSATS